MIEKKIESFDKTKLHCYLFENPNAKYVVQIAHGMQEYSKTYFEFAQFLCENNCNVFLFDQRCHGKTAGSVDKLGKTHEDMFEQTVKDHIFISNMLEDMYHLPLIFFGHSYGSFIGQSYLQSNPIAEKIILSGSCYMKSLEVVFGKIIAKLQCKYKGKDSDAKLIESMSLKKYPKYFKNACWITSDENKTKEFYNDKFNGTVFPANFYYQMFKHQLKLYDKKALQNVCKQLSILLVSGTKDPVGKFSKGINKLYKCYKKYNMNVELKLYPDMRHGVVQEVNRKLVFDDILKFIEK